MCTQTVLDHVFVFNVFNVFVCNSTSCIQVIYLCIG